MPSIRYSELGAGPGNSGNSGIEPDADFNIKPGADFDVNLGADFDIGLRKDSISKKKKHQQKGKTNIRAKSMLSAHLADLHD